MNHPVRRALISVFDKQGIAELAQGLAAEGVEIVSTGSTAARIREAGVAVTEVSELTGFPECLDGRVKTLHPRVHAGLLADLRLPSHAEQLKDLGIEPFELVVVNLYPFAATVAGGGTFDEIIEKIDIGGPSMVRAAAKNFANVAVVVDPAGYDEALEAVRAGGFTLEQRQALATRAFAHTATYDAGVASWMQEQIGSREYAGDAYELSHELRYGENPHQKAWLYTTPGGEGGLASAEQLGGKPMSYNNYVDADAAWRAAWDQPVTAVAVIKHNNPCGIAIGADVAEAHRKAHATDPQSAYGGVIATNGVIDLATAQQIKPIFTEVVLATAYDDDALELLRTKKNLRILRVSTPVRGGTQLREIDGGALAQEKDLVDAPGDDPSTWTLVSGEAADEQTFADLAFAWRAIRAVKSNSILLAKDGAAVGVGMGQVNRVDSCKLAVTRARELSENGEDRAAGSVAASDAFFPFADGAEVLLEAGVKAIVQPGGSIRDGEVIDAAKAAGVTMYLTGTRHFAH